MKQILFAVEFAPSWLKLLKQVSSKYSAICSGRTGDNGNSNNNNGNSFTAYYITYEIIT
jgi:hypothetical protein